MESEIYEHVKEGLTKRGRPKCEPSPRLAHIGGAIFAAFGLLTWFVLDRLGIFPDSWIWVDYALWIASLLLAELGVWKLYDRLHSALLYKVEGNDCMICVKCGYILNGLGEAGACPECAMPFEIAKVQRFWRREWLKEADLPDPEDIRILREQMERERR